MRRRANIVLKFCAVLQPIDKPSLASDERARDYVGVVVERRRGDREGSVSACIWPNNLLNGSYVQTRQPMTCTESCGCRCQGKNHHWEFLIMLLTKQRLLGMRTL